MVMVDNVQGVSLQTGLEADEIQIKFYDSFVYGESEDLPDDCPSSKECVCANKTGLILFGSSRGSKDVMISDTWSKPMRKIITDAAWGTEVTISNVTFADFSDETLCGAE